MISYRTILIYKHDVKAARDKSEQIIQCQNTFSTIPNILPSKTPEYTRNINKGITSKNGSHTENNTTELHRSACSHELLFLGHNIFKIV